MVDTSQLMKLTNRKGTPPAPGDISANLQKPPAGQNVPLQLKITPELRREFRTYAAERDLELSDLFRLVWSYYREHHG